mmetsp:Transcript_29551/g.94789  ORF Transcript_29551/g.94789 Transcript_29551/m.94789 type:complete len:530 (-) Transcript_29551:146-1735(-)
MPPSLLGAALVGRPEAVGRWAAGGKGCRHEDPRRQHGKSAIDGLHSNWVTDAVLAMARTSDRLIREHNVIEQFAEHNITCIINLQEVGEHPHCGDGVLHKTGFSYSPELFMRGGLFYYNFSWRDMSTPQISVALDIIKVMDFTIRLQKGKVAVHCHAGLGRTGLVIACYLVYTGKYTAEEAIKQVRTHRHGALQTRQQEKFVFDFDAYLRGAKQVYHPVISNLGPPKAVAASPPPTPKVKRSSSSVKWKASMRVSMAVTPVQDSSSSLTQILLRQKVMLHGSEARKFRDLPKIVSLLAAGMCMHAQRTKGTAVPSMAEVLLSCELGEHKGYESQDRLGSTMASTAEIEELTQLVERVNLGDWDALSPSDCRPRLFVWLLAEWVRQVGDDLLTPKLIGVAVSSPNATPSERLPPGLVERGLKELPTAQFHVIACLCGAMREIANSHLMGSRATADVTTNVFEWLAHLLLTQKGPLPNTTMAIDRLRRVGKFLEQAADGSDGVGAGSTRSSRPGYAYKQYSPPPPPQPSIP